jgi:hypothetical protein
MFNIQSFTSDLNLAKKKETKMLHTTILSLLFSSLIWTINAKSGKKVTYLHKDETPKLTLPWGTYEGKPYGEDGEVSE